MPANAGKSSSSAAARPAAPSSSRGTASRPGSEASSSKAGAANGASGANGHHGPTPWPALIPLGHHQGKPPIPMMRPVMIVGSRHNAHLHLLSRQISKAHAVLINSDGKVYVRDLASRTHTYVNGQEVREADLVDGDLLKIGSFTFKFQAATGMKQKPVPDTTPAGQLDVEGADFPLQIDQRVMLVGRRPNCDISLVEESCSTAHAIIFSMGGTRYVRDLGSRTGTFVNGAAVKQQELSFGDVLKIGDTAMTYQTSLPGAETGPVAAGVDELEDLVGTAPLVEDDFGLPSADAPSRQPAAAEPSPFDALALDFDDHPAAAEPQPAAAPAAHDELPIPIAGDDDAHAAATVDELDPQTLVGENLMGEKLSSSATGAGMQAAAREAIDLAADLPATATPAEEDLIPFDVEEPTVEAPAAEAEAAPLDIELAPEAPPVEDVVQDLVHAAPTIEPVAEAAPSEAVSEDDLLADLMAPAPQPPTAEPVLDAVEVEPTATTEPEASHVAEPVAEDGAATVSTPADASVPPAVTFSAAAISSEVFTSPAHAAEELGLDVHHDDVPDEVESGPPPVAPETEATETTDTAEPAAETEIFFGDEPVEAIAPDVRTPVDPGLEWAAEHADIPLPAGSSEPAPVDDQSHVAEASASEHATADHADAPVEVIEPTEPTAESALQLDEVTAETPAPAELELSIVEPNLSDTSFGRQVEEFAAESPDPIVEPVSHEPAAAELPEAEEPLAIAPVQDVTPEAEIQPVEGGAAESESGNVIAEAPHDEALNEDDLLGEMTAAPVSPEAASVDELLPTEPAVAEEPLVFDALETLAAPEFEPVEGDLPIAGAPDEEREELDAVAAGEVVADEPEVFAVAETAPQPLASDQPIESPEEPLAPQLDVAPIGDVTAAVPDAFDELDFGSEPTPPEAQPEPQPEPMGEMQVTAPAGSFFIDAAPGAASVSQPETAQTLSPPPAPEPEPEFDAPMAGMPLIPGMSLDLTSPTPDFVGGMPLALNELPPPPPMFGRVQVAFGDGSSGPRALVDEPLVGRRGQFGVAQEDEPGPFDNLQVDIDDPVPGAPPIYPPAEDPFAEPAVDEVAEEVAEPAVDEQAAPEVAPQEEFADEAFGEAPAAEQAVAEEVVPDPFEEDPFAEPAVAEAAVDEQPTIEALPEEETPADEASLLESPAAEAPAVEPVAEEAEAVTEPEPAPAPKAGRTLFQNKTRVPPPPRGSRAKAAPTADADEAGFGAGGAGAEGAFGGTAPRFGGLTGGGATPQNVDVFAQGFSADLSTDPFFGNAVKPVEREPEVVSRRKPAAPEAAPGKKKGKKAANPEDANLDQMAGQLADDLGAPPATPEADLDLAGFESPTADDASAQEADDLAGTQAAALAARAPSQRRAAAAPRRPVYEQPAATVAAPRRRGSGGRVVALLVIMFLLMIIAFAAVFTFVKQRIAFNGSITFENFGKLTQLQRNKLQDDQKSRMVGEELRTVAMNEFVSRHPNLPPGFLADREEFARNEVRVKWIDSHAGAGGDTLLYTYIGADKVADAERVRAVLTALYKLDEKLLNDANKARQQIADMRSNYERRKSELAILEDQRQQKLKAMGTVPAEDQLKALRADAEAAGQKSGTALAAARNAEAELKQLTAAKVPSQADGVAKTSGDPELDELNKTLDQMKARLETAKNTVAEQAEMARKGLDSAIEEAQRSTAQAQGVLKDNPELSEFVAQAQKLQETVQKLTGDLLDRQQKSYDKLLDDKRFIEEHLAQRRQELWDTDKELKRLRDDMAMRERGYNAAVSQGYDKEAAQIKRDLESQLADVEKRKREMESDPMLMTLTDLLARRQQEIGSAQKQLEADRKQADALTDEMTKNFARLAPSVEKLPESQRALAQQMTGRMEAVNNARKALSEAIVAKNPEANAGLKLLDDQVAELAQKVDERKKTVAALNNQALPADERERQQAAIEQKRQAYEVAVKTEAAATKDYLEKRAKLFEAEAMVAAAKDARAGYDDITQRAFNLREKELPQLEASLAQAEALADSNAFPAEPKIAEPMPQADMRIPYASLSVMTIGLVFSLLIFFTGGARGRIPQIERAPYAYGYGPRPTLAGAGEVDATNVDVPAFVAAEHGEAVV